jgi:uncharacterized protein (TIGR02246 family)
MGVYRFSAPCLTANARGVVKNRLPSEREWTTLCMVGRFTILRVDRRPLLSSHESGFYLQRKFSTFKGNIVHQKLRACGIVFLLGIIPCSSIYSQTPSAPPTAVKAPGAKTSSDAIVETIQKEVAASILAFNKRDAKAVAAFWAKDCEYVDESGQTFIGRGAVEKLYTELFAAQPEAKLQIMTDSIRLLSDSVAIEDGQSVFEPSPAAASIISKHTAIHVKVDGKWLLASVRETSVDKSSTSDDLADLEWLIGDWTAEENGARTDSKCRWIVNKKFVERSYTTTQVDGTSTTGLQIIGWNSQANHVQSWNFSADGGHAIGIWSAIEGGWLAKVSGTTGQSVSTTAVNLLKRLDDNAYVWQSVDRTIGEVRLADTDEVIMRRKPASK